MPPTLAPRHTLLLLLLLALVAALYLPGLAGPFMFDDGPALTANPYLRIDGSEFDDWRTAAASSRSGPTGRPLAMLSFAANYAAADAVRAVPVKAVNLLLHLACGVLVFLFARVVLRRGLRPSATGTDLDTDAVALLAAALWLLAPLQVSTVLYAVQRMTVLSTLFALLGLLLFARRRERWAQCGAGAGEVIATALWLALLALLAMLCKENGVLLLWLLPVLEVSLFRGQWAGRPRPLLAALGWLALLAPLLPLALWWTPQALQAAYAQRDFTLPERVLTQLRLLWQYLAWMVYPDIRGMSFQHDDIPLSRGWLQPVTTLLAASAWLATLAAALLLRHRVPLLLFALLFFLVGHVLESSFWPLEMVYEHRNYLPGIGVFIALAAVLAAAVRRRIFPALRPQLLLFAVLAACATLLFLRVFSWGEPLRLAAVNAANHPQSSRTQFFLAQSHLRAYDASHRRGDADSTERSKHLLFARHHFELMYQNNPRDMAAIVMLYYMDRHHLPQLQQYRDWFTILEQVARDRPLQASDTAALEALVDCYVADACGDDMARLLALFDTLEARYPRRVALQHLRFRLLQHDGATPAQRLAQLQEMQRRFPGNAKTYQYLLQEYAAAGDTSALFEGIATWLRHDPDRRQLGVIRRLFGTSAEGAP